MAKEGLKTPMARRKTNIAAAAKNVFTDFAPFICFRLKSLRLLFTFYQQRPRRQA
jgi:hypothetical protein